MPLLAAAKDQTDQWILGGLALFALFMLWRGWRLGFIRMVCNFLALIGAYLAGVFVAPYLAWPLRFLGLPEPLLTLVAGIALGVLFYFLTRGLSALLFKRTAQQGFGPVRWVFGALGALLGLLQAVLILWIAGIGLKFVGTAAQNSESAHKATAKALAGAKQRLEDGSLGGVLQALDPVPDQYYRVTAKSMQLLCQPESLSRFAQTSFAKKLAKNPKVIALCKEPKNQSAIRELDFFELLKNPSFLGLLGDPAIRKSINAQDLEKALDEALGPNLKI